MPEELRPPSAEELEAADRELNTGLPIELVNVHARAAMEGITPAQYMIRALRERRIADQDAERPERDRRIAELVKAGHFHDATGHEDTLCQCPSPGPYAPQWPAEHINQDKLDSQREYLPDPAATGPQFRNAHVTEENR